MTLQVTLIHYYKTIMILVIKKLSPPVEFMFERRNDTYNHRNLQEFATKRKRSSPPEVFLVKGVLKICSKVTGEHPCRSVILIKFQSNFIEITLRDGCSPVNLLHIFRTHFSKNTSGWLLLNCKSGS